MSITLSCTPETNLKKRMEKEEERCKILFIIQKLKCPYDPQSSMEIERTNVTPNLQFA